MEESLAHLTPEMNIAQARRAADAFMELTIKARLIFSYKWLAIISEIIINVFMFLLTELWPETVSADESPTRSEPFRISTEFAGD